MKRADNWISEEEVLHVFIEDNTDHDEHTSCITYTFQILFSFAIKSHVTMITVNFATYFRADVFLIHFSRMITCTCWNQTQISLSMITTMIN